jgi:soluble lytic murein transglycosylase-like protein
MAVTRSSAAPGAPGRSGLALGGPTGGQDGFEGFLTALAAGEAEAPGAARNLARLKAAGLHNEMLANLLNLDGAGETRAAGLVERANLEALLSSGRFGNLLGGPRLSSPETGMVLKARDLSSWRQKNSPLSLGRPISAEEAARPAAGPAQAFLIRPPQRVNRASVEIPLPPLPERLLSGEPSAWTGQAAALSRQSAASWKAAAEVADLSPKAAAVEEAAVKPAEARPAAEPAPAPSAGGAADRLNSEQLDKLVRKVALALNMDPNLIKAVIKAESNFNPKAVSKAGAKGLMQLMPGTAKELGVKDPFNPVENVWAGARYLKKMLDRHSGNINNALASYNWGPGNFDRHGKMRLPGETRRYISTVNKHYASLKQNGTVSA